ncbi:Lrp/AsnC family transcriptional regulator [bacterium]|nr:Lrp/AsnC family transcriptional regulator [bacterium]
MREELLSIIEKNSKISIKELSVLLGREELDVANEIAKLENEGVICAYQTLIDWEKTSIEKVTGLIEVKVAPQREQGFDKIAKRIYNYSEVKSVYLISGGFDLMVTLEEKTFKDIAIFVTQKLATLEGVLSTSTHFILKKYKDHGAILDKEEEDIREVITP